MPEPPAPPEVCGDPATPAPPPPPVFAVPLHPTVCVLFARVPAHPPPPSPPATTSVIDPLSYGPPAPPPP